MLAVGLPRYIEDMTSRATTENVGVKKGPFAAIEDAVAAVKDGKIVIVVDDEDTEAESIDFSAAIGAEYALDMGVFFQARYNLGLTDVYDGIDSKNSVFQIGLGYKF